MKKLLSFFLVLVLLTITLTSCSELSEDDYHEKFSYSKMENEDEIRYVRVYIFPNLRKFEDFYEILDKFDISFSQFNSMLAYLNPVHVYMEIKIYESFSDKLHEHTYFESIGLEGIIIKYKSRSEFGKDIRFYNRLCEKDWVINIEVEEI